MEPLLSVDVPKMHFIPISFSELRRVSILETGMWTRNKNGLEIGGFESLPGVVYLANDSVPRRLWEGVAA